MPEAVTEKFAVFPAVTVAALAGCAEMDGALVLVTLMVTVCVLLPILFVAVTVTFEIESSVEPGVPVMVPLELSAKMPSVGGV